ncbi:PAS domain S-box protein [Halorubrum sp. AJ67]|uniref:sensor histidine kinase n=1 Tax=Halorubrum sp. AJ67 TaxID=1173487 RepID=UPI0003DD373A|nr:PAS domain S-box protein [Halorubrum sp. AJ67]CDK39068.1 PAS/PAC sensor signal transduction histidine kinase [Halorubrum sp. AJ67]
MTSEEWRSTNVLVVTADRDFAAACERSFPNYGDFTVHTASTVGAAIDVLGSDTRIECIVSDHNIPDTDGIAFLEAVRAQAPILPFILFTTEGSETVASRAISADVTEYLIKDAHTDQWDQVASLIENAVAYYRNRENIVNTDTRARELLDAADDMIGVVRDGQFTYLNKTGFDYLGIDSQVTALSVSIDEVLTTDTGIPITQQINAVQAGDTTLDHSEGYLHTENESVYRVEITATHITWADVPALILIIRDIGERKDRKRELSLKTRAINEAPIGITIADASQDDNPLIYANASFEQATGYSEEGVHGRNCRFLQGDGTDPEPVAAMREAIDAEEPVTVELRNYRKDGTEFWNRVTIAPIRNDAGDVTHYVGFQEDVSDRVEHEQMLRRFRRAVEAAGHVIYITDPDGTITYVNPAFERITGYDSEAAIGQTPAILSSGEMSEEYYADLWATISEGDVWQEEIQDQRQSGEIYYAHQTIAPITTDDGDVEAYVAIQTDITEQKEREADLQQFERAVEGASELIAAINDDYRYLFANEAYREFHHISSDTVTEKTLSEGIGEEAFETSKQYVKRAFAGQSVQYRTTRALPGRSGRRFSVRYHPLEDEDGTVWAVVATMRDITEQIERERQLATLDRLLRHTLRNELNVIQGHAEMIKQDTADEFDDLVTPIIDAADRIVAQADKEREIVELLAETSSPETIDLTETLSAVVADMESTYPAAEFRLELPDDVSVIAIPEVKRAIREVVENAVRHTDQEQPQVEIRVRREGETVRIYIADNGPGIPPKERAVITENEDIDALTHSSGMGLWLVKRILSRANGTVRIEEKDPRGAVVILTIPAQNVEE